MTEAHRRKKNPELVRAQLVASAIELAALKGLDGVGVDAVARAAGVTKGGFFHHFPSKQALVDAVFSQLIDEIDAEINDFMAADTVRRGRFTRAYLNMTLAPAPINNGMLAVWASTLTSPDLRKIWTDWLNDRLATYGDDEVGVELEIVRFAADGLWLDGFVGVVPADVEVLRNRLIGLTTRT